MSLFERVNLLITEEKNDADDTRSKAQKFTDKINKAREERRKLKTGTDGKRARRVINATGEKKTGSFSKGNLSFPGDRSGAYQATKSDIAARKGFSNLRPGGLKADERNPFVNTSVRKGRVDDLGGDIYDQPKFSQKKFDKSIGGAKKPTTAAAPGLFGKGDTKGQMNVKDMDRKAYKITKPEDIKKTAGYKPFAKLSRDIQDYKDKNVPGGPRKTGRTSFKGQGSGSRFDPDIGMAPDDSAARRQKKVEDVLNKAKKKQKGYSFKNKPTPGSEPVVFKKPFNNKKKVRVTGDTGSTGTTQPSTRKYNFARDGVTGTSSDSANRAMKDYLKGGTKKTSTAYRGILGKEVDTAAGRAQFDARKLKRMSKFRYKGLGGKARPALPKIAKSIGKAAAKNPRAALVIGGATLATAAIARGMAMRKNTLGKGDFTKTAPIQDRSGQNVRFKYDKDSENLAKPYLTTKSRTIKTPKGPKTIPGSLTKFRTGDYKVPGINVNQNMKQSAFEKQIKNLNKGKGTGFFGGSTKQDKKFLKSVKNASRPT